jgi:oligopeptide transport system substrate-binding protein
VITSVAESWEVDETGTDYKFKIRKNVRWSIGDSVRAMEFVAGMPRAVDPKTKSGSAGLLTMIKNATKIISGIAKTTDLGVSAIDENVVKIKLEHPAPYILEILSQLVCSPLHPQSGGTNAAPSTINGMVISNGPYKLLKWIPGAYVDLSRNEMYWNKSSARIALIRYVNENSESTKLKQYTAGELDITYTIPMPDIDRVSAKFGAEIQTAPILGTLFLALNTNEPPLNASKDVRKALSMTVERELISRNVTRGVTPAYHFVANGVRNFSSNAYAWAHFSSADRIREAQSLYTRAGYSKKKPLRLKLFFNSNEGIRRLMIVIASGWKQSLGVETELVSTEFRLSLEERKIRKNWDAIRLGWYADFDDPESFLDIFRSSSNQNDAGYFNADFDRLINAATQESNIDTRQTLLKQAESILLNDYSIIPIYFYNTRHLVEPYVGGATITPTNRTYSKYLYWKTPNQPNSHQNNRFRARE